MVTTSSVGSAGLPSPRGRPAREGWCRSWWGWSPQASGPPRGVASGPCSGRRRPSSSSTTPPRSGGCCSTRLAAVRPAVEVVGEGADGPEAVELAREHQPALMLLDVSMPEMDGLEALPRCWQASPAHPRGDVQRLRGAGPGRAGARELGAAAFIEKSVPIDGARRAAARAISGRPTPRPGRRLPPHRPSRRRVDSTVLDEHLERFREVFDEAAIGMATMTLTGRLVRANRRLAGAGTASRSPTSSAVLRRSRRRTPADAGHGRAATDIRAGPSRSCSSSTARRRPATRAGSGHARAGARLRADGRSTSSCRCRTSPPSGRRGGAAAERGAVPAARRGRQDYAIFMLDPDGHVVSWNSGAQRIKGYTADEIIGQHFRVFYPPEVAGVAAPRARARAARCGTATTRRRAGGSARTARRSGPTC